MAIHLKPLRDQVIVITGASSGIGLLTAGHAAKAGATVVLAARSAAVLSDVVQAIRADGGTAAAVVTDVGRREDLERLAEEAVGRFGRIDTWVNNAGVAIYGRLVEVADEDSRRLFDTNFWGVVNGSLISLPHLRKEGGALINIGSEVSEAVVPLQGMYSASKHAVKGFTDALRLELQAEGARVSVTLIQPTAVNTPYPQHARNYMSREPKLPSPQIDPHEVAMAILHAAATETRHIKVGAMSKMNTTIANLMPRMGDWISRRQINRQQENRPPRNPAGSLHQPGGSGHTHGYTQDPQHHA
jgi:short-subunit dehydrogenase